MPGPLEGIVVVEIGDGLAGPWSAMALGDMGAEVIKIERLPDGDPVRGWPGSEAGGASAAFHALNRNKRSLAIDLASDDGLRIARDLIARADVVVESMGAGVADALGLGWSALSAACPQLIWCSITGYGHDPEVASRGVADPVIQAECGFMATTGFPDSEPVRSGLPMIDFASGFAANHGILAALYEREESGRGQRVDITEFDVGLATTYYYGMAYLVDGRNPSRFGNGSAAAAPIGVFPASDGIFQMTIAGERVWKKLCEGTLGRPDLMEDPRFTTNSARVANGDALRAILDEIFLTDTRDNWVERLRAAGAPGGSIRTIGEAVDSDEVQLRGLTTTAPHAAAGTVPVVRSSIRYAGTPLSEPVGSPLLGEHSAAVLRDLLGLDEGEVARLARAGHVLLAEGKAR